MRTHLTPEFFPIEVVLGSVLFDLCEGVRLTLNSTSALLRLIEKVDGQLADTLTFPSPDQSASSECPEVAAPRPSKPDAPLRATAPAPPPVTVAVEVGVGAEITGGRLPPIAAQVLSALCCTVLDCPVLQGVQWLSAAALLLCSSAPLPLCSYAPLLLWFIDCDVLQMRTTSVRR
jgi:hypothetical protein